MQIIIELFIPYYYYYCWIIMFSNVNCNNSEYNNNIICYLNVLINTINIILTVSIDNVDITIHTIYIISYYPICVLNISLIILRFASRISSLVSPLTRIATI